MKPFLNEDFLLQSPTAQQLYHEYAAAMPIIDYHNHLPPAEIAANKQFKNITEIWLKGDHYKWRAMRSNGVDENNITGNADDYTKFKVWAATVPYTMRNPLYHWTHLELRNPFGITTLLNESSAEQIYHQCNEKLADLPVHALLNYFSVETLCTTDDPCDDLRYHLQIKQSGVKVKVLPAFRPDKAMAVEDPKTYNSYIDTLAAAANVTIGSYRHLLDALKKRHNFFHDAGCRISDHGLETMYADDFTLAQLEDSFSRIRSGKTPEAHEVHRFKSATLHFICQWNAEKQWTQQFHIGALRNNNTRLLQRIGADAGVDSIGDWSIAQPMSAFFNRLDKENKLAKTIIYNNNPAHNAIYATMIGNFQDGITPGKLQFGAGWWFLDQKDGMEEQMNVLSNMGLLSRFIGMTTDSRSFLSWPRHEYFRRILCNLIGNDVENGLLPHDIAWLGKMVQNISYYNAKQYFNL
ncbi:glucuronate isomerase [Agriterribacter sp.]|uniref:glucuronate isomerase n=1 Tax=Agriterribacter sp. TaxID=2821509 RepID=UPI002CA5484C|nr:glucuronate isomerase [Agriterribacter sp.]HTN05330.1 glucuronate isomerase [Agriterribacter sp.]